MARQHYEFDRYYAVPGSRYSDADAQVIGPVLEGLGNPTAQVITDEAKKPDSPLHVFYPWDVNTAANLHWNEISRNMARSIRIRVVSGAGEECEVRRWYSRPEAEGTAAAPPKHQRPYVRFETVRDDPKMREALKQECKETLIRAKVRYAQYLKVFSEFECFRQVFDDIDRLGEAAD